MKPLKVIATIIASLFALVLVSLVSGWASKHFGQLYLEDEAYCTENICFKMGSKGGYPVAFKSADGKKWEETFPYGKIYMFPKLVKTVFYSLDISGRTACITEVAPAPGESNGEIVGIYCSQDLAITWTDIK